MVYMPEIKKSLYNFNCTFVVFLFYGKHHKHLDKQLHVNPLRLVCWVKFSADNIFKYFSQKTSFDISRKLSPLSNPVFWEK